MGASGDRGFENMADFTDDTRTEATTPADRSEVSVPTNIGRYKIESVLGSGGFGTVFLAFDEQLRRRVAIKVPRSRRINQTQFCNSFLSEARTLARLDHPHIVPVYDVGSTDEYPCFIVSKYIAGASLSRRLPHLDWSWQKRADVLADVAEALHYAHSSGLVHRDVKPGNVLLDESDQPYLADFGLALSDEDYDFSRSGVRVGTLMYMSPEQVRGEAHLVDGRADIFSLGVLMYELLTGTRPFAASSREQVMRSILERDATPLRQRNQSVPKELERICLRALERQKSQRYSTALDFATELKLFAESPGESTSSSRTARVVIASAETEEATAATPALREEKTPAATSANRAAAIVPKGLRSFGIEDADFFLQILPGPTDRFGVPESVRFWKHRIESDDPEQTFRAGVIYGPSGCGKSSFVRAGLIPQLSSKIAAVMVSATPNDTEDRLKRSIASALPELRELAGSSDLIDLLRAIRLDERGGERTVVLMIDQFEQWLSQSHTGDQKLIEALRQCDGVKLKCLFLVRNDFWMSISQVMEDLEAPIEQGRNSAAVELFDLRHARKVLFAFGHAYGALPATTDMLTDSQRDFLEQSVQQLARDGSVICVRLAVYAQMIRDRAWEPKTLAEFGGVQGLGARFLEDTFYGASAAPQYTRFRDPAREILRSLLPAPGSDIRGTVLSEKDLAGVAKLPSDRDLKKLLRLLSEDLRLLTPTDALGTQVGMESESSDDRETVRYYQLAHDYLVPSLRSWLNAKQRESAEGRAWLCLEDRASFWRTNREPRQLPSWIETLQILFWTRPSGWTETQGLMMQQAKRRRVAQAGVAGLVLLVLMAAVGFARVQMDRASRQRRAVALVSQLKTARVDEVMPIIRQLDEYVPESAPGLQAIAEKPIGMTSSDGGQIGESQADQRFRALLALSRSGSPWMDRLLDACGHAGSDEISLARDRIRLLPESRDGEIQSRLESAKSRRAMLRYATLLSDSGTSLLDDREDRINEICEALVEEDPYHQDRLADHLGNAYPALKPVLVELFHDSSRNETQRAAAARTLAKYADSELLVELLLSASASQHFILMAKTQREQSQVLQAIERKLWPLVGKTAYEPREIGQVANGLMALLRLDPHHPLVETCLSQQPDPSVRTRVILEAHHYGVPFARLWNSLRHATDPVARQALILATDPFRSGQRTADDASDVTGYLQQLAASSPHQSDRSAARTVLRGWGVELKAPSRDVSEVPQRLAQRNWWVNEQGITMVILELPVYASGPQALVAGREEEASAGPKSRTHLFAISSTEVSREQRLRCQQSFPFLLDGPEDHTWPAKNVFGGVARQ